MVTAVSLYTILAYERFHGNTLLLGSCGKLQFKPLTSFTSKCCSSSGPRWLLSCSSPFILPTVYIYLNIHRPLPAYRIKSQCLCRAFIPFHSFLHVQCLGHT